MRCHYDILSAIAAATVCCLTFAGCAGVPSSTETAQMQGSAAPSEASSIGEAPNFIMTPITGEKSAASIADHIQQYLDQPEIITAYEKPILEHARDNGGITPKVYEEAWSRFKTCMANAGFPVKAITRYPSGLYDQSEITYANGDYTNVALSSAHDSCYNDISVINQVYGVQIGNPNFYANRHEAIIDCLHRNDLIPRDYNARQYEEEELKAKQSGEPMLTAHPDINLRDERVRGCFAANMSYYGFTY